MKCIKHFFAGITIVFFTTSFISPTNEWYLFNSNDYSVEFPKKPVTEVENVPSQIGDLKMETSMYDATEDKDDNFVYGLTTTEYPDSLINSARVDILPLFFRNVIDGSVSNIKGKLLSEENIQINGFPGKETRVNYENGLLLIKTRTYMVHSKMFIIHTITAAGKEQNTNAIKFLNSLKLK